MLFVLDPEADVAQLRLLTSSFVIFVGRRVKEDEANAMALFTAEHIPMMSAIARTTANAVNNGNSRIVT